MKKTMNANIMTRGFQRIAALLLCTALIAAVIPQPVSAAEDRLDTKFRVGAYYHDQYGTDIDTLFLEDLDYIIYSFARPYPDGSFRPFANPEEITELVTKAHAKGIKVFLSIGGLGSEMDFDTIAGDANSMIRFSKGLDDLIKKYDLDGIDMDWESPVAGNAVSMENAEKFLIQVGEQVKSKGLYYTIAVGGTYNATSGTANTESFTKKALDAFDWIHIMTYSMETVNSPLSFPDVSLAYWHNVRGIDENKLTVGVPFFSMPSWKTYDQLVEEDPENAYLDYVADPSGNPKGDSNYNGIHTINEKVKMALERGGGVFSWVINTDSPDRDNSLTVTINNTVKEALAMGREQFVNKVSIIFKNREIKYNASTGYPLIDSNNRTLVPFRQTAEAAGFEVSYDAETRTATAETKAVKIVIPLGQNQIYANGTVITIDTTAEAVDGRTYIPMRAFFEAAGYQVTDWHSSTKTAYAK